MTRAAPLWAALLPDAPGLTPEDFLRLLLFHWVARTQNSLGKESEPQPPGYFNLRLKARKLYQ